MAKLEWDMNGGLGRAIIGKVNLYTYTVRVNVYNESAQLAIPMNDLVRPDPRNMVGF